MLPSNNHRRSRTAGSPNSQRTRLAALSFLSNINLINPHGSPEDDLNTPAPPPSPTPPPTGKTAKSPRSNNNEYARPGPLTINTTNFGGPGADGGVKTSPSHVHSPRRTMGSGFVVSRGSTYPVTPGSSSALTRAIQKERDRQRESEGESSTGEKVTADDSLSRRQTTSGEESPSGEAQGTPSSPILPSTPSSSSNPTSPLPRANKSPLAKTVTASPVSMSVAKKFAALPLRARKLANNHDETLSSPAVPSVPLVSLSRRGSQQGTGALSRASSVREASAMNFLSSIVLASPFEESRGITTASEGQVPDSSYPVAVRPERRSSTLLSNALSATPEVEGSTPTEEVQPFPWDGTLKQGESNIRHSRSSSSLTEHTKPFVSNLPDLTVSLGSKSFPRRRTIGEANVRMPVHDESGSNPRSMSFAANKSQQPQMTRKGSKTSLTRTPSRRNTICQTSPRTSSSALPMPLEFQSTLSTASQGSLIYRGSIKGSLAEALANPRVYFASPSGQPFAVFSVIRFHDGKIRERRAKRKYLSNQYIEKIAITGMDALKKKKAESYAHFITQSNTLGAEMPNASTYNPYYLDNPELRTGKHRTVISLPCFMGSIIQYTRPADLKRELNEHFRSTHPNIDASLTLSQIRNIKTKLLLLGEEQDLELSSIAKSYAYFEKLVLKNLINKGNRKLLAGCCLLLATKVNEPKGMKYSAVLKGIEKHLGVSTKDVLNHEFSVYAALEFTLYIQRHEFMPHFERIFATMDYNNVSEYLGDNQFFLST